MTSVLDELAQQQVVIVAGKGGVGKTTLTALIANAAARSGRSVLAVDLDGKPQLGEFLDGVDRVDTMPLSPGTALEEYLADHGFRRMARRLVRTGVIELVAAATPGINDVVVLGKIKQIANAGTYDLIVVDGPAAGHALSMLTSAQGLIEVASGGPVRRQADEVNELLRDPDRCGVVLVTLAETTPVSELIETAFEIEDSAGVALNGVVVNQLLDDGVVDDEGVASAADDGAQSFLDQRREVEREALARLDSELPLPRVGVPYVPTAGVTARDIDALADSLSSTRTEANMSSGHHRAHGLVRVAQTARRHTSPTELAPSAGVGESENELGETGLGDVVASRTTLLCVGSGGVGKTTTAAALGLGAAQRGRNAVVVTIDPARRLAEALGMPDGLTDTPTQIEVPKLAPVVDPRLDPDVGTERGSLWAMMLDPQAMLRRVVEHYASDAEQVQRIVTNPMFNQLVTRLSGTQEYMATEALYELAHDDRFDLVIVDTPPSRQTLTFLESPGLLSRFLSHRLFQLMMLPTRSSLKLVGDASQAALRQVGKVVGSDVLADATAFFQAFAGMDEGFRERAAAVDGLLRDPSTGFVLTAGPNTDTVAEALWFADRLSELDVEVAATIINRLFPVPAAQAASGADRRASSDADDVVADLANAQRQAIRPLIERATSTTLVPMLGSDVHDISSLVQIADVLFAASACTPDGG